MKTQLTLIAYIVITVLAYSFFTSKTAETIVANLKAHKYKIRLADIINIILIVLAFMLLIAGSILIHFSYIALGGSLMLTGLLLAWAWLPLQRVQIWLKSRRKVH